MKAGCTFEVLTNKLAITDPGVRAIGEIVHDPDLRHERYQRADRREWL